MTRADKKKELTVCVYCGARDSVEKVYKDEAVSLARHLVRHHMRLVYGAGSTGLMGLMARTVLSLGGHVTGITPYFLDEPRQRRLSHVIQTETMHERKEAMARLSHGFIALPGGLGTLDELCEILSWKKLALHNKPIILVNTLSYWDPLIAQLQKHQDAGFMDTKIQDLLLSVKSGSEAVAAMKEHLQK